MTDMPKHEHYKEEQERKLIFAVPLANYLLSKGHKMLEITYHKKDSSTLIFVFENTNKLHFDIDMFKAENQKGRKL